MSIVDFSLLWVHNSIPIDRKGKEISAMSNPANYKYINKGKVKVKLLVLN
jgi:hypothetical protein